MHIYNKNCFFSDFEIEKNMFIPTAFMFILNADQTLQ